MSQIMNCYVAQQRPGRSSRSFNLRYLNFGLFGLATVLGICYLANMSSLAVKGFALQELKSQMSILESEKTANEELVNSSQSYYSLNQRTGNLGMVAIGDVEYLKLNGQTVARR